MRTPIDEFAARLRQLRKDRGLSAYDLASKAGATKTLIGKWEREQRRVDRAILQRVADELVLTVSERQELFRLADLRSAPAEARDLYEEPPDGSLILFEALLGIPHQSHIDFEPRDVEGHDAGNLVDALGWVLACIAASRDDILHPFRDFEWPDEIIELGIVPRVSSATAVAPLNKWTRAAVRDAFPNGIGALDPPAVYDLSRTMAEIYRDRLFQDRDRTRKLVSLVDNWELHWAGGLTWALTLRFRHTADNERFGFRDVSQEIVDRYAQDELAMLLWTKGRPREKKSIPAWSSDFGRDEYITLHRIAATNPIEVFDFADARHLYDAQYMMRSPTWPYVLNSIRERPIHERKAGADRSAARELEGQVRSALSGGSFNLMPAIADPWLFAAIDPSLPGQLVNRMLGLATRHPRPPHAESTGLSSPVAPCESANPPDRAARIRSKRKKKSPTRKRRKK